MKRSIKVGYLHDTFFVPGIGEIKKTIDTVGYRGAELSLENGEVTMLYKGFEILIPITNFKCLVLNPVKTEEKAKK